MLGTGTLSGQPQASNMVDMVWDSKLAAVAQAYVETYARGHNSQRTAQYAAQGGSGYVGENYAGGSSGYSIADLVAMWWNEHKDYNYATKSSRGGAVGHYTQMAWAKSTKLGCGFVAAGVCGSMSTLICNYSPGGVWGAWDAMGLRVWRWCRDDS